MEGRMSWATFGKVVVLIVIFAFVNTFVKCMHDTYCTKCKTQPQAVATP
jgi:hypothetical protein